MIQLEELRTNLTNIKPELMELRGALDLETALSKLEAVRYDGPLGLEILDRSYVFEPDRPLRQSMDWFLAHLEKKG